MLERGLSALRMNPVPADVRELMFKVKKAQGVDIARSFCGLNDHRNLRPSIEYARSAGMVSQVALCLTDSPVHTMEHYIRFVDHIVDYGCDELCLKDMAGTARPSFLAGLTSAIRKRYPDIHIQYHAHC
jgi:pyruvate carboxylase subunit B